MNVVDEFIASKDAGWSLSPEEYGAAQLAITKHSDIYLVIDNKGQYIINKDRVTTIRVRKDRTQPTHGIYQDLLEKAGLVEKEDDE